MKHELRWLTCGRIRPAPAWTLTLRRLPLPSRVGVQPVAGEGQLKPATATTKKQLLRQANISAASLSPSATAPASDQQQEIKNRAGQRSNFKRNSATAPINLNFIPQTQKRRFHHFQLQSVFLTLHNILFASLDLVGLCCSKNFY